MLPPQWGLQGLLLLGLLGLLLLLLRDWRRLQHEARPCCTGQQGTPHAMVRAAGCSCRPEQRGALRARPHRDDGKWHSIQLQRKAMN